jgi:hypothetical protein
MPDDQAEMTNEILNSSSRPTLMHPAALPLAALMTECEVRRTRRSGPGGQHRNKVETAVVLTHTPSGVTAEASERRSQAENLAVAQQRLRVKLAVAVRTLAEDSPSDLWCSRLQGGKLRVNPEHADFPTLLAEALDTLAANDWRLSETAEKLAISGTQLTNLMRDAPDSLTLLNSHRAERGLAALK